jgi:hypothetical protein
MYHRSCDARYLVFTSTDGYATVIRFSVDELGIPLSEEMQSIYTQRALKPSSQTMDGFVATHPSEDEEPQQPIADTVEPCDDILTENSSPNTALSNSKKRRIQPIFVKQL